MRDIEDVLREKNVWITLKAQNDTERKGATYNKILIVHALDRM